MNIVLYLAIELLNIRLLYNTSIFTIFKAFKYRFHVCKNKNEVTCPARSLSKQTNNYLYLISQPWENLSTSSCHQWALLLNICTTFMLFDNQFIIKATCAWEQEMGVEFTKEQCDL